MLLSINGIDAPCFDDFPFYVAKRASGDPARSGLPYTIVRSTQWFEFALNPVAVTHDTVSVEDWLIQPVAVDAVAASLLTAAESGEVDETVTITGLGTVRPPELTARYLRAVGDLHPVRVRRPAIPELSFGALLAPCEATVVGPALDDRLRTVAQ